MLERDTPRGARAAARLEREEIAWLTTVRADGQPQSSPIWFRWDGERFLVFSQPGAQKVRNLRAQPLASLHLDGDEHGGEIITIEGTAALGQAEPSAAEVDAYVVKYREAIRRLGYSPEQMLREYSTAIRVTPTRVRLY